MQIHWFQNEDHLVYINGATQLADLERTLHFPGLEEAANALETLGAGEPEVLSLSLPGGEERKLILCQKLRFTPKGYPRHGGTILKHPL